MRRLEKVFAVWSPRMFALQPQEQGELHPQRLLRSKQDYCEGKAVFGILPGVVVCVPGAPAVQDILHSA